jgi:hypothetical protein
LFNDVDLVALEKFPAVQDVCGWIFFEVAEGDRVGEDDALMTAW